MEFSRWPAWVRENGAAKIGWQALAFRELSQVGAIVLGEAADVELALTLVADDHGALAETAPQEVWVVAQHAAAHQRRIPRHGHQLRFYRPPAHNLSASGMGQKAQSMLCLEQPSFDAPLHCLTSERETYTPHLDLTLGKHVLPHVPAK